ncbi:Transmembrane protein 45B [Holothuria leucospilota]|uniref:Transmembrane protein 45B n=1 Tax=Holothuria leucospilota TaxID=206669 RepID=A0A9Q0YIQ9_HOLLE|nr:Transmembrane protein 45B [Holothuria leucospilota]
MLKANISDDQRGVTNLYIFSGHLYTGVALISVSLFWLMKYCCYTQRNGYQRQRQGGSILYKLIELVPWEGSLLLFCGLTALGRVVTTPLFRIKMVANDGNFQFDSLFGWQHVVLSSCVVLFGVFIILADTKCNELVVYVKPVGSFTFAIFGTVFVLHAIMKDPVDSQVHNVLTFCSYGMAISFALETAYPEQAIYFILRIFFAFLQGTFWIQAAYILEPPNGQPWDGYDKLNVMFVSTSFLIQCLIAFWIVLLMFFGMNKISQKIKKKEYTYLQNEIEMSLEKQENKIGG